MQKVFDYILTQLNDNTDGLTYKGNYIFRFFEDKMTVVESVTGSLYNEELEITPVSVLSKAPVTFVENNKRIDWMLELGFLMRIEGQEYDATTDLDYANLVSVLDDLQGETVTIDGKKYSFKTQEPDYSGYSKLGKSKYAIISTTLNVSQISFGYFGQDSTFVLGSDTLDVTRVAVGVNKEFYTSGKNNDLENDFNKPIGRSVFLELTFNYNGETELLNEARGKATLTDTYTLTETFATSPATTFSYTVTVESCQEELVRGQVKQLTVRFVEV